MVITSKEMIVVLLGIVGSAILAIYLKIEIFDINKLGPKDVIIILGLAIIFTIIIFYKRIKETENEVEKQEKELKRLDEKLKIYEQLINVKVEIKELQKRVFKK